MVQDTYLSRVRRVFTELVKDNQDSIDYKSFIFKVRSAKLRSTSDSGSAFRQGLRGAVMAEMNAALITLNVSQTPNIIMFTPGGKAFYGSVVLSSRGRTPRKRASTLPPSRRTMALAAYQDVYRILQPIRDTVAQRLHDSPELFDVNNIPSMIRYLLESEDALRSENGDLTDRINDLNWASKRIEDVLYGASG